MKAEYAEDGTIYLDQEGCARCHSDGHSNLVFRKFRNPVELEPGVEAYTLTHWSTCPETGEPILMRSTKEIS